LKSIAFCTLILLIPVLCLGQEFEKFLSIGSAGKTKRMKYFVGDRISLQLNNLTKIHGEITNIKDSTFVVEGTEIPVSQVSVILLSKATFVSHALTALIGGSGAGFIIIDSFNNLITSESPVFKKRAILIGAGLMATAALINVLIHKKYKIKGSRTIKIVNTSPI
jgi:hypothetical protein